MEARLREPSKVPKHGETLKGKTKMANMVEVKQQADPDVQTAAGKHSFKLD